ncbi:MAG: death-on-curing family protein [Acidimicrobiaceae bacterium]|nr:death-on-curing family protein [Acidimicrobiaceae bacterium]
MREIEYLDLEDALEVIAALDLGPVRDIGLLDSAVARPRSSAFGKDAYPTPALKAAALIHSLARNHALVDGNKRLAWTATQQFLVLNGHWSSLVGEQVIEFVLALAKGELEVAEIADRMAIVPMPT